MKQSKQSTYHAGLVVAGPFNANYVGLSNFREEVGSVGPLVVKCLMDSGVLIMAEMGESASCNRHSHCELGAEG